MEFKNPQEELGRFRSRIAVAGGFVLVCFMPAVRAIPLAADRAARLLPDPCRGQSHLAGADRAQPRPDRRPQRRRAGAQLFRLHAGDHAFARRRPGKDHRRPGDDHRNRSQGPAPLQEADGREQEFRDPADPHPPFRRGGGEASSPTATAFPASRSRRACSASTPAARSHRTSSATSAASPTATWKRSRRARRTPTIAAPTTSARPGWSSATSSTCTASAATSRSRSMPAAAPCAPSRTAAGGRQPADADHRRRIAAHRRARPSATARGRWWRSSPRAAASWPWSRCPTTTPTCSSMASTRRTGASSTSRRTSRWSIAP
jgi:hypothetical protein